MEGLYPIVRRKRRPLIPQEQVATASAALPIAQMLQPPDLKTSAELISDKGVGSTKLPVAEATKSPPPIPPKAKA